MLPLINPFPFVFIIATSFGVLMHDTQIDHAASVAITTPMHFTNVALADSASKSNDHVHVERVSFSGQGRQLRMDTPKIQPRDDDRRYIQSKKHVHTGNGSGLWPSV